MGRIPVTLMGDYHHAALDQPEHSSQREEYTWSTKELDEMEHSAKTTLMTSRRTLQKLRWRTSLQAQIDAIAKGSSAVRKDLVEQRDFLDPKSTMGARAKLQKTWEEVNRTNAITRAIAQQKERKRVLCEFWDFHDSELVKHVNNEDIEFFYWPLAHRPHDCQDLLPATWLRHTFMTRDTQMSKREVSFVWLMEDNLIPTKEDHAAGKKVAGDDQRLRPVTCVPPGLVFCSIPKGLKKVKTVDPTFCDWSQEKDKRDYCNQRLRFQEHKKKLAKPKRASKMKVKDTSSKKRRR
jgi:hypothetical protein